MGSLLDQFHAPDEGILQQSQCHEVECNVIDPVIDQRATSQDEVESIRCEP